MSEPRVVYGTTLPAVDAYAALFATTGWNTAYRLPPAALHGALGASWRTVTAWHDDTVVGAGRLISDGVQYALVVDLIVHPDYHRRGIGSELLRRLLVEADGARIRDVLLFAADGTEPFYARHGFRRRPASAPGMLRRRASDLTG